MPVKAFVFSQVPFHPLFEVSLGGADVDVDAFLEWSRPEGTHDYGGVLG